MKTIKITTRARNLGYGSTSQVVRAKHGGLAIDSVDSPDVVGGLRSIEAARSKAMRNNSGHDWREALFLGNKIIADRKDDVGMILASLREFGWTTVTIPD